MPARRRYIDPSTGDYLIVNGAPREDMTPASRVVMRLRTRRGSIPGLPNFGSRLYTIKALTPGVERRAEDIVREALADLITAGELPEYACRVTAGGDRLAVEVSYRDPAGVRKVVPYSQR